MPEEPIARAAYDQLAEAYGVHVVAKAHNAYYDHSALLALLPPVDSKRVLDAGCGSSAYTARLVEQ